MSCNDSTKENVEFFGLEEIAAKMLTLTVRDAYGQFILYYIRFRMFIRKKDEQFRVLIKRIIAIASDHWKLDARRSATFRGKKKNNIRSGNIKPYETCRLDRVMCRWKISMVKSTVPFTLIQRIICTMATMADADVNFTREKLSTNYHQWRSTL